MQITAPEVRVVGVDGEQLGIMPLSQALTLAQKQGLDLIEVAKTANPPVCKIIELGKFKFQERKKAKKATKQKKSDTKQLTMGVNIDEGDLKVRINQARKFLEDRDRVKVIVQFRGREVTHPEVGQEKIGQFVKELSDIAKTDIEGVPPLKGKNMEITFIPK